MVRSPQQLSPQIRIRYYQELLALLETSQSPYDRMVIASVKQQLKKAQKQISAA